MQSTKKHDNITKLLNRKDKFTLLKIPKSRLYLVCTEDPPSKWTIDMVNLETDFEKNICQKVDRNIFEELLLNIFTMDPVIYYYKNKKKKKKKRK